MLNKIFIFSAGVYIGSLINYFYNNYVEKKMREVELKSMKIKKSYLLNESIINTTGRNIELYDNEKYVGTILATNFMLKVKSIEPFWFTLPSHFTEGKNKFKDGTVKMRGYCEEEIEGIEKCNTDHDYIVTADVANIIEKSGLDCVRDVYRIDGEYDNTNGLVFVYTSRTYL